MLFTCAMLLLKARQLEQCVYTNEGLQAGDELCSFGDIVHVTAESMRDIPSQVREGVPISVSVARFTVNGREVFALTLTPMQWPGRGLLGCHIVP